MAVNKHNTTKRLTKKKEYVIDGNIYNYAEISDKVIVYLKNGEQTPTEIIKQLGLDSVSHVHLLPTMLSDGLIDSRRKHSSDVLVYMHIKSNLMQELLYPIEKVIGRLNLTGKRKIHHLK